MNFFRYRRKNISSTSWYFYFEYEKQQQQQQQQHFIRLIYKQIRILNEKTLNLDVIF